MKKYLLAIALLLSFSTAASATQVDYSNKDLDCMAKNMYHEARGESDKGMIMVAEVTLNRTKHDDFPSNICKVVYERGAFAWTSNKGGIKDKQGFEKAKKLARKVLEGKARTGTKALFFKRSGSKSRFHSSRRYLGTVGHHDFYR